MSVFLRKRRFFIYQTFMPRTKAQKQKILDDLKDKVARQKAILLVGITGLKVKDLSALRKKLKGVDANIQVVKKTLVEKALKEQKLEFDKKGMKTEVALVFAFGDAIAPAKTVYQLSKENEALKILAGYIGNQPKDAEYIITLAQLPSREEILARLVGSIASPISGLVNVLQGNIKGLLQVLTQIKT